MTIVEPLLEISGLHISYRSGKSVVNAVCGVDMEIFHREIVGLAGESGCGKTSVGSAIAGLIKPEAGSILFKGAEVRYGKKSPVQMVFQDPHASLNPRMMVGEAIMEVIRVRGVPPLLAERKILNEAAGAEFLLDCVGLDSACMARYPHQLSGGQRQRVVLARALAAGPELIVADEAVSALDVSVQAQVLNLISSLRDEFGTSFLFIAHDLAVVGYICDRLYVMNSGIIVESGKTLEVLTNPRHPYTRELVNSVPDIEKGLAKKLSENMALKI